MTNGKVTYAKNGSVFYTSANTASAGLRGHVIFFDANGSVRSVGFGSGGSAAAGSVPVAPASAPTASQRVVSNRALEYAERVGKLYARD